MYKNEIQKCLQYARGKTVNVASINRCIIDKDLCDELYNKEKNRLFFCFMLVINDQCHLLHVCLFMLIYVALFSPNYTSRAFVLLIHSGPANQPWRYFCRFSEFSSQSSPCAEILLWRLRQTSARAKTLLAKVNLKNNKQPATVNKQASSQWPKYFWKQERHPYNTIKGMHNCFIIILHVNYFVKLWLHICRNSDQSFKQTHRKAVYSSCRVCYN